MAKTEIGHISVDGPAKVLTGNIYSDDSADTNASDALAAHISSLTPHPAYDDPMSLDVYLENGMA